MSKLGGDISRQRGTMGTGWKKDPWDKMSLQPASSSAAANQGPLQQSSVPYAPGLQAKRQTETTGQSQKSDVGAAAHGGPPSSGTHQEEEEYHPQPTFTSAANQGPLQQSSVPYAPGLQAKRQTETTGQSQKSDVGAAAFGGPSLPSFSPYSLLPTPKGQNEAEELRAETRQRTQLAKGVSPGELARKAAVNETRTYQPTSRDLERQHDVFEEEIAEVDQLIKKAFSSTKEAFPDGETAERIRELRHWKELLESQRDELADLPSPTVSTQATAEEAISRYEAARKALVQDTMSSYAAAGGKKPSGPAPVASTYAASAGALKSEEEREREARLREAGQAYAALPFPSVGERVGLTLSGAGKQFAGSMAQAGASVVDTIGLDGLYHYFSGKSGPYIPNPMVRSVLSPFEKRLINDVEGFSDKASESGAQDIAKAREGLDPAGKMLVSAGVGAAQMGGDAILSLATGGSALWFMLTRAFGGGVQEAKAKGYGREQQALLGLTSAATEYFTERLFGGNPVYDTDAGLINRMVGKLVKNPTVMEFLSSAPIEKVTEGLEEIVSDLLNPMAEWAITGTRPEYELDQIIEDGIVGVITAVIAGGGAKAVKKVGQILGNQGHASTGKESGKQKAASTREAGTMESSLVSDAMADQMLRERTTVSFLTRKGGLKLTKGMSQEQKRAAVRQAVENVVHKRKGTIDSVEPLDTDESRGYDEIKNIVSKDLPDGVGDQELTKQEQKSELSEEEMTEEELGALLKYKSSESYTLNAALRDGYSLNQNQQRMMEMLDQAVKKAPVYQGTVFRRMSFDMVGKEAFEAFLREHQPGTLIQYPAFTSTSSEVDGYTLDGELTITLVIKSKNGRNMDGYGNNFEQEVLFPRFSAFYIDRVEIDDQGKPVIYMEEVIENGV